MPLESIALIGGALLGIVVAAIVGSLLGRRFRTWREYRASADGPAATPSTPAQAPPPVLVRVDPPAAAAVQSTAASPDRVSDPPTAVGPSATIADPLTRSAVQRTDGDATFGSTAAFARLLSDAPPPVATRTPSSVSPAMRDRGGAPISDAAPAVPLAPAARPLPPASRRPPRRDRRRGVLAAAGVAAVLALGGIVAVGALRPVPDGRVAQATATPDGLPASLGPTAPPAEVADVRAG